MLKRKSNFVSSRKQPHVPSDYNFQFCVTVEIRLDKKVDKRLQRENVKQKSSSKYIHIFLHIQAYSEIFRHNQTYSGFIQAYTGMSRTLYNPGISRTPAYSEPEAYSEPWYIQNLRHIQISGIFRSLAYLEPLHSQYPGIIKTGGMLRTLSNIYDGAFCENS